ncbi:MAG: cytochrome c biogenesis protein CcsA [Phycisphaerae bacterium]|nr:cytochrome c biogenesis protein CcsA [Phycisphaerae bacterium]
MEFKPTIQGTMIYVTMACWILAVIGSFIRRTGLSGILFFVGFLIAVVAWVYRWIHVQHVPMQNLFEVFLTLGMLIWPIWLFSRRVLGIRSFVTDILIGLIVLYPAGFSFHAEPQRLPPALQSWLFAPHVAVYMLSYVLMARAAVQAGAVLWYRFLEMPEVLSVEAERAAYQLSRIGFPLLTLGLLLGSVWGQRAWGDYWGWDPKELWSLASWLVYIGYFHFRYMYGTRYPRINSIWVLAGLAFIIITLLWVNLSRIFPGLHNYAT